MVLTAFAGGIVFELDHDGRFSRVWGGDPTLLVRPERELLGKTVSEIFGSDEGDRFVASVRRVLESGEAESFDYVLNVQAGRRAFRGEVRRRVLDDGERTVIVLVRDVTKQMELQAELVEAERLATASLELLAREIGGLATPCAREALDHARAAVRHITNIAASDPRRGGKPTHVEPPPQSSCAAFKVLIVDDEPMFLRSLQLLLRATYEVTACKVASDALALLSDEPTRFDAVLCDLSMPHIDGIDFHREMERLGVSRRFVLMTGGAFTTRTKEFLTRSGCPRIAKPFTREELETVLSAVAPRS